MGRRKGNKRGESAPASSASLQQPQQQHSDNESLASSAEHQEDQVRYEIEFETVATQSNSIQLNPIAIQTWVSTSQQESLVSTEVLAEEKFDEVIENIGDKRNFIRIEALNQLSKSLISQFSREILFDKLVF